MNFSKTIKDLRKQNNLTQDELAKKLFVTRNAVSKWETDKGYPNMESLILISRIFDVSIDYLINKDDIKLIALENNEKLTKNRNLILALIVFLIYSIIGTLIPSWLFNYDSSAGLIYFLLLAPIGYLIVGLISGFISENREYTLLAGLIAIIPTYFFFDMFTNISLGLWEFLYYGIFALVYLFIRFLVSVKQTNEQLRILVIIFSILFAVTFLAYLVLSIIGVINNLDISNSSPWYTPLIIYSFIFFVPLLGEGLFLMKFIKKRKNQGS